MVDLSQMFLRVGASSALIKATEAELGLKLPADYLDFMKRSNGAAGVIGDDWTVHLWPVDELKWNNERYARQQDLPGILLIASDGADSHIAFDTNVQPWRVVFAPFLINDMSQVFVIANSFNGFLHALHGGWDLGMPPWQDQE